MTTETTYPHNRYWDKETVIRWIRNLETLGLDLSPRSVREWNVALYLAAHRYCGGWAKALRMAGIDPATVYVRQMRSVKEVRR